MKESKYLMEFTTRKEIVFKVFAKCIIFVQVSESCPYGRHLQDVQVGSSTLLSGHPHKCWLLCSCRIIIQHEDMTSITKALTNLHKRWDECDIEVGNFMIDCQQSEENAIRAVFPDSVVYLCVFHRLQAWLRWLVNTKIGVSNYQTYCMALLRVVGDAKTEDGYTKVLMALQKSHVWLQFPNFRNYYTNQWAPKNKVKRSIVVPYCINISPGLEEELFTFVCLQMWVQAFHMGRQLYDNTNNGIETQNKTFKYSFLSYCRNMSMSRLIYLLIHIFVPAPMAKLAGVNI